jgi:hypothetical protein
MNTKAYLIVVICIAWGAVFFNTADAQVLDPIVDYRYTGEVIRNPDGTIKRSNRVINAFKKQHPCPSTGLTSGACPGWAIDHVIPLVACGRDAVSNMQWLPLTIKACSGTQCKDRWERKVNHCPNPDGSPNASDLPLQ